MSLTQRVPDLHAPEPAVSPPRTLSRQVPAFAARALVALAALAVAAALVAEFRGMLNPDAGWFLYCSNAYAHGRRLYVDLLEINPPLAFWLDLPAVGLHAVTGWPLITAFRLYVVVVAALSATGAFALTRGLFPGGANGERGPARVAFGCALAFVAFPLLGGAFGQREHLALLLALPWLALSARRAARLDCAAWVAAACGACAGLAMAIKPQYFAVWAAVAWCRSRYLSRGELLRVEDAAVAVVAGVYGLLVLTLTPEYLEFVQRFGTSYLDFGRHSLGYMLVLQSSAFACYVALAAWWIGRRAGRDPLADVLAAAAAGFLAAAVMQHKGWSYHYVPARGCTVLLAAVVLARAPAVRLPSARRLAETLAGLVVATYVLLVGVDLYWRIRVPFIPYQAAIRRALDRSGPARSLILLSSDPADAFPLVLERGLDYQSPLHHLWVLTDAYAGGFGSSRRVAPRSRAEMSEGERLVFDRVSAALAAHRPDLLLIESPPLNARRTGYPGGFDYVRYFSRVPGAAAMLREYAPVASVEDLLILRRTSTTAVASSCHDDHPGSRASAAARAVPAGRMAIDTSHAASRCRQPGASDAMRT
ncbi:MAG TPA: hypothetical protein VFW66_11815 [Gemmatimonadales bacterium]|nr:hypothetical protein [Gemmatimonadales bacterium]